jgi:hypothetical protein
MVYRVIKFRASNDAHIGLFWGPRNTQGTIVDTTDGYYEIVLGGWGNTKSVIRDLFGDAEEVAEQEGAICGGEEWVTITVALVGGDTIVVSKGDVPMENIYMHYTDPEPVKVNYIAVMTGWGSEGDWEFKTVENPRVIKLAYTVDTDHCL